MLEIKEVNLVYDRILTLDKKGAKKATTRNLQDYDIDPSTGFKFKTIDLESKKRGLNFPFVETSEIELLHKEWLEDLNSLSPTRYFDNTFKNLNTFSLEEAYNTPSLKFNYPIILYTDSLFETDINLDKKLIHCIETKQATVVLFILTEGWFGTKDVHFEWLHKLAKKYNLTTNQLKVIPANLKSKEEYSKFLHRRNKTEKVTIFEYNYFKNLIWFYSNNKETPSLLNWDYREKLVKLHYDCKDKRSKQEFDKHFLCFNRAPRLHRVFIFGELMTNPNLVNKSITTMGKAYNDHPQAFYFALKSIVQDDYKHSKERLLEFYKNYNSLSEFSYDISNIKEINTASNLNLPAHLGTFLNIVTETLFEPNTIFLSEKIYKPILCCQPFIVVGNPHYLRKLQELGFETFSDIWDEGYDQEENLSKRMEMIVDTLIEISKWDNSTLLKIQNKITDRLTRNFEKLIEPSEPYQLYNFLNNEQ